MELKILEDNQKPLLSRREVLLELTFEGKTPARLELRKKFADKLKVNEELVVVKNVYTQFGERKAKAHVNVYNNKEDLEKIEPKYVLNRHAPKEKKEKPAQAEKPEEPKKEDKQKTEEPEKATEPKAEKPAEAKPEEKVEEKKDKAEKPAEPKPEEPVKAAEEKPEEAKPKEKPVEETKKDEAKPEPKQKEK